MKKHSLLIIFIIFFIGSISVFAILIAQGFRFSGGDIKETGILDIGSTPKDAVIYIDGESKAKTPEKVELVNGTYEIELRKDGYTNWKKQVKVEPLFVNEVNALLYPEEFELTQTTFTNVDNVFFSRDRSILYYVSNEDDDFSLWQYELETSIFDISNPKPEKVSDLGFLSDNCNADSYNLEISRDNKLGLFSCKKNDTLQYYLIRLQEEAAALYINKQLNFNPDSVTFSFNSETLLIKDGGIIAGYNIENNRILLFSNKQESETPKTCLLKDRLVIIENSFGQENEYQITTINSEHRRDKLIFENRTEVDMGKLQSLSCSNGNDHYIAMSFEKSLKIFSLENTSLSSAGEIDKKSVNILKWGYDTNSFIYATKNTLGTAKIKTRNQKITINNNILYKKINPENFEVSWANNSNQIIVYNKNNTSLLTIDFDGENEHNIFNQPLSKPTAFALSPSNTLLILLLKDDDDKSNLYTINLQV